MVADMPSKKRMHANEIFHDSVMPATKKLRTSKGSRRKSAPFGNATASSRVTLEALKPHFEKPLARVAQEFGICVTLLKKICRRHGISRWPHRQITGLRKSIASMEHAIGYFEGARRESYAEQLNKQRLKLAALLEDPTQCESPIKDAYNGRAASASFHAPSQSDSLPDHVEQPSARSQWLEEHYPEHSLQSQAPPQFVHRSMPTALPSIQSEYRSVATYPSHLIHEQPPRSLRPVQTPALASVLPRVDSTRPSATPTFASSMSLVHGNALPSVSSAHVHHSAPIPALQMRSHPRLPPLSSLIDQHSMAARSSVR